MVHLATPFRPDEDHTGPKERQLLAFIQSNPKPQPHDFSCYRDYETAIVRWKEIIESAIRSADIELPSPQGRFHYRPVFNPHCAPFSLIFFWVIDNFTFYWSNQSFLTKIFDCSEK